MQRWFLKGVLAGSVGTALVLGAAAAVAATVGDPFKLGQANTINATSSLYGATAHDQLDVLNLATGATAKALGLLGEAPDGARTLNVANTGGGPAFGLTVNAVAPFTSTPRRGWATSCRQARRRRLHWLRRRQPSNPRCSRTPCPSCRSAERPGS